MLELYSYFWFMICVMCLPLTFFFLHNFRKLLQKWVEVAQAVLFFLL